MSRQSLAKHALSLALAFALVLVAVETTRGQATQKDTADSATKAKAKEKAKAKAKAKAEEKDKEKDKVPLDLNTATAEELEESLPGVGAATAKKIVAGRPYAKVDDLSRAGVPARTIDAIRPMVTVAPPAAAAKAAEPPATETAKAKGKATTATKEVTTKTVAKEKGTPAVTKPGPGKLINLNTAAKEELDALPGIGPVKAQAIIDARPFKTAEDVMKVKGIKEVEYSKIKDLITVR